MADGAAKFWSDVFIDMDGNPHAGVKVYHYEAGTTTPLDAWADPLKQTPASNPVTGDNSGRVFFYGDGNYRLRITTSDDILLYDWDHVRISQDTATMWEGDHGTSLPNVTGLNAAQLFALTDAQGDLTDLYFRGESAFNKIPSSLAPLAYDDLPVAGDSGRIRLITDKTRGIWYDNGQAWIAANSRTVDVREFGAIGDATADDTAAIQTALDALEDDGGGVCFFPRGVYLITQISVPSACHLQGAGSDASVLFGDSATAIKGMITNKNPLVGNSRIKITDLSIIRNKDVASAAYNEAIYFTKCEFVWIERCIISGVATGVTTNIGIVFLDSKHCWIMNNYISNFGLADLFISKTGGTDFDAYFNVQGNIFTHGVNYLCTGILASCNNVNVVGNVMQVASGSTKGRLVLLTDHAKIVSISGNHCDYANICYIISAERVSVVSNIGRHGGIYADNSDANGSYFLRDIKISANEVIVAGIQVERINLTGTCDRVTISDNVVTSYDSLGVASIQMRGCYESEIVGNTVRRGAQHGIFVSGVDWVVKDNHVTRCGSAGFVIDCETGWYDSARAPCFFQNNTSRQNGTYAFDIRKPAQVTFTHNYGRNEGSAEYKFDAGIASISAEPILLFVGEYLGSPEGVVYAGPGSLCFNLASQAPASGGQKGLWMKRSGYGSTGWVAVTRYDLLDY